MGTMIITIDSKSKLQLDPSFDRRNKNILYSVVASKHSDNHIFGDETEQDNIYNRQYEKGIVSLDPNEPNYFKNNYEFQGNNYYQQHQRRHQPPPYVNPLFKQAGTASIGVLFCLLIWRSFSAFEMADQFDSSMRLYALLPIIIISCANAFGFIINFLKPLNFKNHLKFILFLNIVREWVELVYNMFMLVITRSDSVIPRQTYFGRFFMNCWWTMLCISFSKSRWVLQPTMPSNLNQRYDGYAYNNNNNNSNKPY